MSINNIKVDLENVALSYDNLYTPDVITSKRYNAALQSIFNVDNTSKDFHLDMRGHSPEIGDDKGNYLNVDDVNSYVMIVSPDQASAPLMNGKFSFKEKFMKNLYATAGDLINTITSNEILWGEIENKLDYATSIDDLLKINTISINLETPLGSIKRIKKLQEMHGNLQKYILDDSKINEMIDSQKKINLLKYGDIRNVSVDGVLPIEMNVGSFYTTMFGGAYILRLGNTSRSDDRTIVIHNLTKRRSEDGSLQFIKMDSKKLVDELFDNSIIQFNLDDENLENAKKSIEYTVLLNNNYDLFHRGIQDDAEDMQFNLERKKGLVKHADLLPNSWHEINDLMRVKQTKGRDNIRTYLSNMSPETKILLAEPARPEEVINHLLLNMNTYNTDFIKKAQFDREGLLQEFPSYNEAKKKFICYQISRRN